MARKRWDGCEILTGGIGQELCTHDQVELFLETVADTGSYKAACVATYKNTDGKAKGPQPGVTAWQRLERRSSVFAEALAMAHMEFDARIDAEIARRAFAGDTEDREYNEFTEKGKLCTRIIRKATPALIALAKRRENGSWNEKMVHQVQSVHVEARLDAETAYAVLSTEGRKALKAVMRELRAYNKKQLTDGQ